MKFNGKFQVRLIKSTETDAGCAYPQVGKDGGNRISSVRTDGGDSMVCWTMQTFDYVCAKPEVGDHFSFALPCSKAEGTILSVAEMTETNDWGTREYWVVEVDGIAEGAYNSIRDGNPVGRVMIPLDGEITSTTGGFRFRDYVAKRLHERMGELTPAAYLEGYRQYLNEGEIEILSVENLPVPA